MSGDSREDRGREMGIVIKEDGDQGRTFVFSNAEVAPLGYAELKAIRPHQPVTAPLRLRNARVMSTDLEGVDPDAAASVDAILSSPYSARALGLVKGGWLPAGFAVLDPRAMILIDRNVLSDIEGRFDRGELTAERNDFLDLFAGYPIRLNPLLCVMEGNVRRRLDRPELEAELVRIQAKLRFALPEARIIAGEHSVAAIEGLFEDTRVSSEAYQGFLLELAPSLAAPVGRRRLRSVWDKVVEAARRHGVRRSSIVLLAVLSAIAAPNGSNPARGVLKFTGEYTAGDAYGALADLRAIEMLCILLSLFPEDPAQLCTGDRALALFWAGLQASGFETVSGRYRFDLAPVDDLLPGETLNWWLDLVRPAS